jgi:hypothetical protein
MIEVSFSGCNPMPVEPPGDEPIASDPTGIDDPNNEVQT